MAISEIIRMLKDVKLSKDSIIYPGNNLIRTKNLVALSTIYLDCNFVNNFIKFHRNNLILTKNLVALNTIYSDCDLVIKFRQVSGNQQIRRRYDCTKKSAAINMSLDYELIEKLLFNFQETKKFTEDATVPRI